MRLFTHNFLKCHVKGCDKDNFPLKIDLNSPEDIKRDTFEFNADFMKANLHRIDYPAIIETLKNLNLLEKEDCSKLPIIFPTEICEEFLILLSHVLFEISIQQGKMTCNGCGRSYLIKDGIPNLLLQEDEV